MPIVVRSYKQVSREYFIKLLENKEICFEDCKCCHYEKCLTLRSRIIVHVRLFIFGKIPPLYFPY